MVGSAGTRKHDESGAPGTGGADAPPAGSEPRQGLRRIDSAGLLAGAREIEIDHRGELYRLRCTNKGKLILTK